MKIKGEVELADDITNAANQLRKNLADESSKAWRVLEEGNTKIEHPDGLLGDKALRNKFGSFAKQVTEELNIAGSSQGAQRKAIKAVTDAEADLLNAKNYSDVKKVIQNIDKNIDWEKTDKNVANEALSRLRGKINQTLGELNPEYAQAMKPVADSAQKLDSLTKNFSLKKDGDGFLELSDRSIANVKSLVNAMQNTSKPKLKETVGAVDKELLDSFDLSSVAGKSAGDTGRGSRSVLLGGVTAGPLGAALGWARDKMGRDTAANMLAYGSTGIKAVDRGMKTSTDWLSNNWDRLSTNQKQALLDASTKGPALFLSEWASVKNTFGENK
jgi:hypothetical protein